jgi:hypothetical protein
MKKLLFILTFICAVFPPSISSVESLQQLCAKQVARGLVSADMLEQFKNNPDFIQEMGLHFVPQKHQDLIKSVSSYCPPDSTMIISLQERIVKDILQIIENHLRLGYLEPGFFPGLSGVEFTEKLVSAIQNLVSVTQNLSLKQTLFFVLVYHHYKPQAEYQSEQRLRLDAQNEHLRNIYRTLPEDVKRAIMDKIIEKD